jgi:hypothetical protein
MGDEWDIALPRAEALIESLRGFGYSPEAAVADLVDNSISAGAKTIQVDFYWHGADSTVTITDDGIGMKEKTLVAAMRLGSTSPLERRAKNDLGRFGLGLKTASFSQARELTVATVHQGSSAVRRWDLDVVADSGEWRLLRSVSPGSPIAAPSDKGTVVQWSQLDRLVGPADSHDQRSQSRFLEVAGRVEAHLAATFHRFLVGRAHVEIYVNGRPVAAWDPFATRHPATQRLDTEELPYKRELVRVTPYVLPHRSKFASEDEANAYAGIHGWNQQQGFYVYRSGRLLIQGDWLGLGVAKDEHTKLARIEIDFPSSLDHDWQVDVKKSTARPPGELVEPLRRIAKATRAKADEVYRHRGKAISHRSSKAFVLGWQQYVTRKGETKYKVNREHPAIAALFAALGKSTKDKQTIERALRFIEETVPTTLIGTAISAALDTQPTPFGDTQREIRPIIDFMFTNLVEVDGLSPHDAMDRIAVSDPFSQYPEVVQAFREERL